MSGVQPDNEAVPLGDLTNVDLYCLYCGYNLRGLSGDPRRCPECGRFSPLSELTLPAQAIANQLRQMETPPTYCVGLALLLLTGTALGLPLLLGPEEAEGVGCACCLLPALFALPSWFIFAGRFRSACLNRPGWSEVLFEYHLHGLGLCLTMLISVVLALVLISHMRGFELSWPVAVGLTILAGGCVSVVVLAPRIRRRCKAKMDVLQREVAVKLAGEHLRKRLSRPHS